MEESGDIECTISCCTFRCDMGSKFERVTRQIERKMSINIESGESIFTKSTNEQHESWQNFLGAHCQYFHRFPELFLSSSEV